MSEINFLHHKFKTRVTASCVSEDDYQPSNLVSSNSWERDRGFMAYNVVKPPIQLTFSFKHNIQVNRIKLWTSQGTFRSNGFEVSARSGNEVFRVAKCTQVISDIIEISRHGTSAPTNSACELYKFFSSIAVNRVLMDVSELEVKITSTRKCAAVLKRIEVWGKPSKKLDCKLQEEYRNMWCEVFVPEVKEKKEDLYSHSYNSVIQSTRVIPEEFLDSITYELMVFPMRLPCGKAVDQSTIEKHSAIEEKWGRAPSDPFTAKLYSAHSKPLLDTTLKSRIDKFLLDNSDYAEIARVPRTLGRKKTIPQADNLLKRDAVSNVEQAGKRFKPTQENSGDYSIKPLDQAMQDALKSIRERSTASSSRSFVEKENKCLSCSSNIYLYRIKTCDHVVCRECFRELRESQVCKCDVGFQSSDVQRIFQ